MFLKLETVSYRPSQADKHFACVSGVSLEIERGEFVGLMGGSDSGKSTLLALMAGLLRPDEGGVYLDGLNMNRKPPKGTELPRRPALLAQNSRSQIFETSLRREVNFSLRNSGLSKAERAEKVEYWLEKLGFADKELWESSPVCLSEGEKQRLALAGVMVREAPVLLLDEPFTALDSESRHQAAELIAQLNRSGISVVLASNDADILAEYANRVIVMEQGRIIKDGSAKSVFTDYFELMRHNLPIPAVRQTAQRLRERDVNMPGNIIAYDQFIDRLKIIMWRKEK